jgi:hypothetical protein
MANFFMAKKVVVKKLSHNIFWHGFCVQIGMSTMLPVVNAVVVYG